MISKRNSNIDALRDSSEETCATSCLTPYIFDIREFAICLQEV